MAMTEQRPDPGELIEIALIETVKLIENQSCRHSVAIIDDLSA